MTLRLCPTSGREMLYVMIDLCWTPQMPPPPMTDLVPMTHGRRLTTNPPMSMYPHMSIYLVPSIVPPSPFVLALKTWPGLLKGSGGDELNRRSGDSSA